MNLNCKCPKKCSKHGNCVECKAFHKDPEKVISFCKWAETAGFNEPESRIGMKAWLMNDRTPFDLNKWHKK